MGIQGVKMETKSYITITGLVSGRTYGKPPIYKPTLRVSCKCFIKTPIMGRMGQSALHCASDVENPWACALATPLDSVPCPFGKNRAAGLVYPIYICVYIFSDISIINHHFLVRHAPSCQPFRLCVSGHLIYLDLLSRWYPLLGSLG